MGVSGDLPIDKIVESVSDRVSRAILRVPNSVWALPEGDLLDFVKIDKFKMYILRDRIWYIYGKGGKIEDAAIYEGIISSSVFSRNLDNDYFVAFLFTPPLSYREGIQGLLREYKDKVFREILDAPTDMIDKMGNRVKDGKVLKLKLEVIKMLEDRIMGSTVERKEIHLTGALPDGNMSIKEIDNPIEIENRIKALVGGDDDIKAKKGKRKVGSSK